MNLTPYEVFQASPIIPVIVIENKHDALDLAKALYEGGISIMEITLRTSDALAAIELIRSSIPFMKVGSGTVCTKEDYINSVNAGAQFAFSPGITDSLIKESKNHNIPFIPGVSNASQIMLANENSLNHCKLFPASLVGGTEVLKSYNSVFNQVKFCPTGGINQKTMNDYLSLDNVECVGGSWLSSTQLIKEKKFNEITKIAKESLSKIIS